MDKQKINKIFGESAVRKMELSRKEGKGLGVRFAGRASTEIQVVTKYKNF